MVGKRTRLKNRRLTTSIKKVIQKREVPKNHTDNDGTAQWTAKRGAGFLLERNGYILTQIAHNVLEARAVRNEKVNFSLRLYKLSGEDDHFLEYYDFHTRAGKVIAAVIRPDPDTNLMSITPPYIDLTGYRNRLGPLDYDCRNIIGLIKRSRIAQAGDMYLDPATLIDRIKAQNEYNPEKPPKCIVFLSPENILGGWQA